MNILKRKIILHAWVMVMGTIHVAWMGMQKLSKFCLYSTATYVRIAAKYTLRNNTCTTITHIIYRL